jgi:C4-dicarboxylate-specific signal transduction histidine kinase
MEKKESAFYNYIGLISACCAIIMGTFFMYESQIEQTDIKNDILEIRRNLLLKSQNITSFTESAAKIASENYVLLREGRLQKNDYFKYLTYDPGRHGFHMDTLPENLKVATVGSLTYLGTPASMTAEKKIEINMALSLSGVFRLIRYNVKDSPWIYYTSDNFIYLTPYLTSLDFFFSPTLREEKEFYRLARPENNPERKPFWTSAYMDEAGQGLMTTYSFPIYVENRFKGAISIDVTVDQFNRVLNASPVSAGGLLYLYNSKGQLLAGKEISSKDTSAHTITDFFDQPFIQGLAQIPASEEGEFNSIENAYVIKHYLPSLQMTLFYKINRADFWWGVVKKVRVLLFLFLIAIILIIRNLKSVAQVNIQRAALAKSQRLLNESQKIAHLCSWEFNSTVGEIIFSENVDLFFPKLKTVNYMDLEGIKEWVGLESRFEWSQKLNVCRERNCHIQFEALLNPDFHPSSQERFVSLTVKSNIAADKSFTLTGTIQDITLRKQLEKNLEVERAKSIQTSKLAAIGEMSAGVAHEINNPLAIVLSNSNRIRRFIDHHTDEKVLRSLDNIDNMVNRMAKIVKGLRIFARDAENDPFQKYLVKDLIEDVSSICAERFKANEIKFYTPQDVPDGLSLYCNPTQISQVIINLLMNAFDSIHKLPERWIRIDFEVNEKQVKFIISDSGHGIDSAIADKIFQPFFTTKEIGKGTGIGLSISKGLIEFHRGQIYLDRTRSHTTFVIELPHESESVSV